MPYRKTQFVNGEYYHILNRGIDDRDIFLTKADYERFLECLKEFNTTKAVAIRDSRISRNQVSVKNRNLVSGVPLVKIICFCLMPNHFHLLLKQLTDDGIKIFMHKLGVGYANYFNTFHKRQGHLFQGPFKSVLINKEFQFLHITRYQHLNVLDLFDSSWREGKIKDWEKAKKFLEEYSWSSYPIYVGKKKSSFCDPELFKDIFKTPEEYEEFLKEWSERSSGEISKIILE